MSVQPRHFASVSKDIVIIGAVNAIADYSSAFKAAGFRVRHCNVLNDVERIVRETRPFAAFIDLGEQPRAELIGAIESAMRARPALPIVGILSQASKHPQGSFSRLVEQGLLYDLHTRPLNLGHLVPILERLQRLAAEEGTRHAADVGVNPIGEMDILGSSPAIREVHRAIRKVARTDVPVLITGESGTGKELAARAIHRLSSRSSGPFVAINCAGLPPGLIASELFGHERGAFTGAVARKIGRLEAAKNGTCFLDEIGDFPIDLQGHLLRFLQEKIIERVGATQSLPLDVRMLAATNVNLKQAVAEKRFREDLFYRLDILSIHMPALRERGDDIELLARHFVQKFGRELGRPAVGLRDAAITAMRNYAWPGNVRELIGVLQRAIVMAEGPWLSASDLGLPNPAGRVAISPPTLAEARSQAEATCIRQALRACDSNVQRAAKNLGVSRNTLYRLAEKHAIGLRDDQSGEMILPEL